MITTQQFVNNMAFAIHESDQLGYLTDEFINAYMTTDIENEFINAYMTTDIENDGYFVDILKLTTVLGDTIEFANGFYINGRLLRGRMGYADIQRITNR
jgi:hypothetical protein